MISPEEQKELHRAENELLLEQNEMRTLLQREKSLLDEERILHKSLLRIESEMTNNKVEKGRIRQLLNLAQESIHRLQIKIKNLRHS